MNNGLPREEADAKFEALEARLETRLTQLDSKIEQRFLTLDMKIDQRFVTLDSKIDAAVLGLNSKFDLLLQEIRHVGEISVEARAAARSIKRNMLFAWLGTLGVTMTMLFGLWAVGYQIADLIKPR
jgi:hypothetical protein